MHKGRSYPRLSHMACWFLIFQQASSRLSSLLHLLHLIYILYTSLITPVGRSIQRGAFGICSFFSIYLRAPCQHYCSSLPRAKAQDSQLTKLKYCCAISSSPDFTVTRLPSAIYTLWISRLVRSCIGLCALRSPSHTCTFLNKHLVLRNTQ